MASDELIEILKGLGVNALESKVYCTLLSNNGVTAYRLAKLVNKANANVYKAVKVLSSLGGVIIQQTSKEICFAVDPDQFLASLDRSYQEKRQRAADLLNKARFESTNAGIYHLDNAALTIQNAKKFIREARQTIILDVFPTLLKNIKDEVTRAITRGVRVSVQKYDDTHIPGAIEVNTFHADKVMPFWKTEQLNMVVDGRYSLVALFNKSLTQVNHAVMSKDLYFSSVIHVGLSREHFFHQLKHLSMHEQLPDKIVQLINEQSGFILNSVLENDELESIIQNDIKELKNRLRPEIKSQ